MRGGPAQRRRRKLARVVALVVLTVVPIGLFLLVRRGSDDGPPADAAPPPADSGQARAAAFGPARGPIWVGLLKDLRAAYRTKRIARRIRRGETLTRSLTRAGLRRPAVAEVLLALRGVMDFRRIRPRDRYWVAVDSDGRVQNLVYFRSPVEIYHAERRGRRLVGYRRKVRMEKRPTRLVLQIRSTLMDEIRRQGLNPALAGKLARCFADATDLGREIRPHDRFVVLVERLYFRSRLFGLGQILAGSYSRKGEKPVLAYLYPVGDQNAIHYLPTGRSLSTIYRSTPVPRKLRGLLWKDRAGNPMKRYCGPRRTPVHAVARGKVRFAGRTAASGGTVIIEHSGGNQSRYLFMGSVMVSRGQQVKRGQKIGRIGRHRGRTSCLAFQLRRSGKPIDLAGLAGRRSKVPGSRSGDFQATVANARRLLGWKK